MSLIILEGPDGSGKTTFAKYLETNYDFKLEHHGAYVGEKLTAHYYLDSLNLAKKGPVVMDRSWMSEPIYHFIKREGEPCRVDAAQPFLEGLARKLCGVVVLFLPPFELCRSRWKGREGEYFQEDGTLFQVYRNYQSGLRTTLPIMVVEDEEVNHLELYAHIQSVRGAVY